MATKTLEAFAAYVENAGGQMHDPSGALNSKIRKQLGLSQAAMGRLFAEAEEEGLVELERNHTRTYRVTLTSRGRLRAVMADDSLRNRRPSEIALHANPPQRPAAPPVVNGHKSAKSDRQEESGDVVATVRQAISLLDRASAAARKRLELQTLESTESLRAERAALRDEVARLNRRHEEDRREIDRLTAELQQTTESANRYRIMLTEAQNSATRLRAQLRTSGVSIHDRIPEAARADLAQLMATAPSG